MNIINPASFIKGKIKSSKIKPYDIPIEPYLNQEKLDKFKKDFADVNSQFHKNILDIANGTEKAGTSLEDYYAQCVKTGQAVSSIGYTQFLNEKVFTQLGTKDGIQKVIDQSKAFAEKSEAAKTNFNNINTELTQSEARLQTMRDSLDFFNNNNEGVDSEGGGQDWAEGLTSSIDLEAENVESLRARANEARETLTRCNQDQAAYNATVMQGNSTLARYIATTEQGNATHAGYISYLIREKAALIGAQVATAALNAAISFGLSFAIQGLVTLIQSAINYEKDLMKAGAEAAEAFKEQATSIDEYKAKIKELRAELTSGNLTEAEAYDVRTKLLEVQSELYDKYGKEAAGIDLVNGNLSTQLALLKEIGNQKSQDYLTQNYEAIDKAEKKLSKKHNTEGADTTWSNWFANDYSIEFQYASNISDGAEDKYEIRKLIEESGLSYIGGYINARDMTDTEAIEAWGKLSNSIQHSQTLNQNDKRIKKLLTQISEELNDLEDESYQNALTIKEETAVARIKSNDEYLKQYLAITEAIENYKEAIKSGDENGIQKYLTEINNLKENLKVEDEWVTDYLDELFDSVLEQITKGNYIKRLQKDIAKTSEGISEAANTKRIIATFFKGMDDQTILGYKDMVGEDGILPMQRMLLEELAEQAGLSIPQLIAAWVELGWVQTSAGEGAESTAKSYSAISEELDDFRSKIDKFTSAEEKINSGELLDFETVDGLIKEYPELFDQITRVAGGYKIEASAIEAARKALIAKQKAEAQSNIDGYNKSIEQNEGEIDYFENQLNDYKRAKILLEYADKWEKKAKEYAANNNTSTGDNSKTYQQYLDYAEQRRAQYAEITGEEYVQGESETSLESKISATNKQIEERKEIIDDLNKSIEYEEFVIEALENPMVNFEEVLSNVASKFETIAESIYDMRTQMQKFGQINPQTAMDFMNNVPDWEKYITIGDDGNVKLIDDEANYNELIKESSGYNEAVKKIQNATDDTNRSLDREKETLNKLQKEMDQAVAAGNPDKIKSTGQAIDNTNAEINELEQASDDAAHKMSILEKLFERWLKLPESSEAVKSFNDSIEGIEQDYSLNRIGKSTYYNDLINERNKLMASADPTDTEAQGIIDDYEVRIYDLGIEIENDAFEKAKTELDNQLEDRLISHLDYQKALAALNEEYYAPGTTLGNTEDGAKQYKENLREIQQESKSAYDDLVSRLDAAADYGKIIDVTLLDDINQALEGSDIPEAVKAALRKGLESGTLTKTDVLPIVNSLREALLTGADNTEALQDYKSRVTETFEYELSMLQRNLDRGLITSTQYINSYTALWEKHYKDKKEFAEEDLQTQRDILEAQKGEIQNQIDALEAISEKKTQPYQDEIDALNDVKDKYDEVMDSKIKALEDEKDALDKANEAQEKENDLLEKKRALERASINKRLVYMGDGTWMAKRDEEEYKNAKKEYDDAVKQSETDKLDALIEKLNEEKEARDTAIDNEIKSREQAIKDIQKPFDNLIKILTVLVAQQYNLDPEFIRDLLNSEDGQAASNGIVSADSAYNMTSELAKENNRTEEQVADGLNTPATRSNPDQDSTTTSVNNEDVANNTEAQKENTDALNKATDAINKVLPDTAVNITNKPDNLDAEGYLIGTDGKRVLNDGKPIKAGTYSEWAKKHTTDEWAPKGKNVEKMTMEEYYKKQKSKIVPLSEVDPNSVTNPDSQKLLTALSGKSGIAANVGDMMKNILNPNTTQGTTYDYITNNAAPTTLVVNNNVQGDMSEKTADYVVSQISNALVEYTDKLNSSINTSFMKQQYSN